MENDSKNDSTAQTETTPQAQATPQAEAETTPPPSGPRWGYKPRPGFEEQLEVLVNLYRLHPEAIDMGKVTPDMLEDELEAYRAQLATEEAARANLASLKHSRYMRGSKLWSQMLGIYGRANAAGKASEEMKQIVASVEEFLRPKPKRLEKAEAAAAAAAAAAAVVVGE